MLRITKIAITVGIIIMTAVGILLLSNSIFDYVNVTNPPCYTYICDMKSTGYPNIGCLTDVYYYSDECLTLNINCSLVKFKECDECGEYCFCCGSFDMKDRPCPREGKYKCYHFEEITQKTDTGLVCYPSTLENECREINYIPLKINLGLSIGINVIWYIYLAVNMFISYLKYKANKINYTPLIYNL